MGHYDTMQACKRWGHKITDMHSTRPYHGQKFCEKCGSETMIKCSYCGAKIKGYYHAKGVIGFPGPPVPLNCHQCGKSYPWAQRRRILNLLKTISSPIKYAFDSIIGIFAKK